jgi:hypothetical protein
MIFEIEMYQGRPEEVEQVEKSTTIAGNVDDYFD